MAFSLQVGYDSTASQVLQALLMGQSQQKAWETCNGQKKLFAKFMTQIASTNWIWDADMQCRMHVLSAGSAKAASATSKSDWPWLLPHPKPSKHKKNECNNQMHLWGFMNEKEGSFWMCWNTALPSFAAFCHVLAGTKRKNDAGSEWVAAVISSTTYMDVQRPCRLQWNKLLQSHAWGCASK